MSSSRPVITLTAHEEEIVAVLLEAAKPIPTAIADNVDADKQTQLVVRIAGGWVRDKLLGFESDDIDVALENCSGEIKYLLCSLSLTPQLSDSLSTRNSSQNSSPGYT